MKTLLKKISLTLFASVFFLASPVHASLDSNFEAISFQPANDGGDYFSVYGSQTLNKWQGNMGFMIDYANRPLQFQGINIANGRQSIVDHYLIGNFYGALGFTEWFQAGINIPVVFYNWFVEDRFQQGPDLQTDNGASMADIQVLMKFRLINPEKSKVGFSIAPFFSLPSGDSERYMGSGSFMGGLMFITDFQLHERFKLALNLGSNFRDEVRRFNVRVDDQFVYKLGMSILLSDHWSIVLEAFGRTNWRDFFGATESSPFEAGGGFKYKVGDSGFAINAGMTGGIVDGVGAARVRGFTGFTWASPVDRKPPVAPAPPPDPRIRGGKIIIWGKIFFDTDKATIKPISYPILNDVVEVMKRNPQVTLVEVQGHTDIRGSDEYNMKLSQRRAQAVKDYLISKGIASSRLTAKGYGFRKPIASNKTKEGMSQNRRVEFVILQGAEEVQSQ